jgi:hypothetical protein
MLNGRRLAVLQHVEERDHLPRAKVAQVVKRAAEHRGVCAADARRDPLLDYRRVHRYTSRR